MPVDVQVMLEEYRSLRAEINERISGRMTLVGFLAAGAALASSKSNLSGPWTVVVLVGVALVIAYVWARTGILLMRMRTFLSHQEQRINARVPSNDGWPVLTWESKRTRINDFTTWLDAHLGGWKGREAPPAGPGT